MSGAEGKILELGVGLIAALMVIREVLNFLDKRRGSDRESDSLMSEHVSDVKGSVTAIKDKVDDLHEWHNKTDADGVPLWYVRRSLEESIKALGEKIYLQIEVQTEILRHMEKMEEHYQEMLRKRRRKDANGVATPES
ncbi:MAG TPA: hypothetical protein PKC29_14760 [Thermodesulfobacteriota bacterium]|nr:hypothetical protein [Thermodesulfobacteriota bacterium]